MFRYLRLPTQLLIWVWVPAALLLTGSGVQTLTPVKTPTYTIRMVEPVAQGAAGDTYAWQEEMGHMFKQSGEQATEGVQLFPQLHCLMGARCLNSKESQVGEATKKHSVPKKARKIGGMPHKAQEASMYLCPPRHGVAGQYDAGLNGRVLSGRAFIRFCNGKVDVLRGLIRCAADVCASAAGCKSQLIPSSRGRCLAL